VATHVFRIAQEAVTNAVTHAQAQQISLALTKDAADRLQLAVRDDGVGLSRIRRSRSRGLGLRIMRYRAGVIGAELCVEPAEARGTIVTCTLPGSLSHVPHTAR
jgi:signal transduction histidine kinase